MIKQAAGIFLPGVAMFTAAQLSIAADSFWLKVGLVFLAWAILAAFFVQKYPKTEALKWGIKLRKGQVVKVELEGK